MILRDFLLLESAFFFYQPESKNPPSACSSLLLTPHCSKWVLWPSSATGGVGGWVFGMRGSDQAQFIARPETTGCGANQDSSGKKKEGMVTRLALNIYEHRQSPQNHVSRLLARKNTLWVHNKMPKFSSLGFCSYSHVPQSHLGSFTGGASSTEPTCQCRRLVFDPWVRKMPWRRKWQPALAFLPGQFHWQRSLAS